ncbi:hypothetical protein LCGC14_1694610 [marine sediment metagenome]|uniref:Uncharacterized protein n=1 Tax=marine sediment metagenome TaxID=412755 RepID=A0A0F9HJT7_9ZZZZ
MIMILMVLVFFYFLYMLILVVPDKNSLIILTSLSVSYVICFGIKSRKPVNSLYAFLLITLFLPSGGNNWVVVHIVELPGVSMLDLFLNVAAFTICIHLLRPNPLRPSVSKRLRQFCILISLTAIVSFTFALVRAIGGSNYLMVPVASEELVGPAPLLHGAIFLYGCTALITRIKQIEGMFLIIVLSGVELVLEAILYFYLELPLPLAERSVSISIISGQKTFRSLIFADNLITSFVCLASIGCVLYFAFTRKTYKFLLLLLIPLLFLPIGVGYERAPLVGAFLAVFSFFLFSGFIRSSGKVIISTLIVCLSLFINIKSITINVFDLLFDTSTRRPLYFINYMDSWSSRVGSYLRGMDVVLFSFPFGVGPKNMVNYAMSSPSVPTYFLSFLPTVLGKEFYMNISSGSHVTGPHNFYIYFMAEEEEEKTEETYEEETEAKE